MTQQVHFWIYTQKNWKQGLEDIFIHLTTDNSISFLFMAE